jgi:hypothetical protein
VALDREYVLRLLLRAMRFLRLDLFFAVRLLLDFADLPVTAFLPEAGLLPVCGFALAFAPVLKKNPARIVKKIVKSNESLGVATTLDTFLIFNPFPSPRRRYANRFCHGVMGQLALTALAHGK